MREDQDAQRARRFHEPGRGDRLARRSRMAEAIAAGRTRVRARVLLLILDFLVEYILDGVLHRLVLVFRFTFDDLRGDAVAVSVRLRFLLV